MHVHVDSVMLGSGPDQLDRRSMTMDRSAKKFLPNPWLFLPAVSGPLGGLMIKLEGGSVWVAAVVGAAPCAVFMLPYSAFVIGYVTVVAKWVCSGPKTPESMERLIAISANSVVAVLSLTRIPVPSRPTATDETNVEQRGESTSTIAGTLSAKIGDACGDDDDE
jgi:hypothetical protein